MSTEDIRWVRLDYRLKSGGDGDKLLDYLDGLESSTLKDVFLQSARSYWMPLALKQAGVSSQEGQGSVDEAVADLLRQILRICRAWNIDPLRYGVSFGSEAAGGLISLASLQSAAPAAPTQPTTPAEPTSGSESVESMQPGKKGKSVFEGFGVMSDLTKDWPVNPVDED